MQDRDQKATRVGGTHDVVESVTHLIDAVDAKEMNEREHGGDFSLDASVCIAGDDRSGLERLLRYCA